MPPKIRITELQIIQAAIEIIRSEGTEAVNARSIANKLGCSVHPIFRVFSSMEGLKQAIYQKAEEIYNEKMLAAFQEEGDAFRKMGKCYIEFAKAESQLFRLLFMTDAFHEKSVMDIVDSTEGDSEVVEMLMQGTGLQEQHAKELYAGIWVTTHGIATLFATNQCRYSDREIDRLMENAYLGLVERLRLEEKNAEGGKRDE